MTTSSLELKIRQTAARWWVGGAEEMKSDDPAVAARGYQRQIDAHQLLRQVLGMGEKATEKFEAVLDEYGQGVIDSMLSVGPSCYSCKHDDQDPPAAACGRCGSCYDGYEPIV